MDEIKELIKRYKEIVHSEKNQTNRKLWEDNHPWFGWMWRGVPKPDNRRRPFTVIPDNTLWSPVIGFNVKEYQTDPLEWIKNELKMRIYRFNNWDDDYYFENNLYISMCEGVREFSLFGAKSKFFDDRDPCMDERQGLILKRKKTLKALKCQIFILAE